MERYLKYVNFIKMGTVFCEKLCVLQLQIDILAPATMLHMYIMLYIVDV